jgi:hypothetical protein
MKRLAFPLIIMLISLCGCPFSLMAHGPAALKPSQQDVVGVYQVTAQNLTNDGLDAFKGHQPLITINNDGSCVISDFPVWNGSFPYAITEWLSFSGKWSIVVSRGVYWGITCEGVTQSMEVGDLDENGDGYSIVFPYGDPDDYETMVFKKMP